MENIQNFVFSGVGGLIDHVQTNGPPSQDLQRQFGVIQFDECQHDFNCALADRILVQGKLYLYTQMVVFYSNFNNKTIIGDQTIIRIPYIQIILIQRKPHLKVFDNSLEITTVDGTSYFFTSFISRDKAHDKLLQIWKSYQNLMPTQEEIQLQEAIKQIREMDRKQQEEEKQLNREYEVVPDNPYHHVIKEPRLDQFEIVNGQQVKKENVNNNSKSNNKNKKPDSDGEWEKIGDFNFLENQREVEKLYDQYENQFKNLFQQRNTKLTNVIRSSMGNWKVRESIEFENMSCREVFSLFFSNEQYEFKEKKKTYRNFIEFYMVEILEDRDIEISDITPRPPEIFSNIYSSNYLEMLEFPDTSMRQLIFTHPVKQKSMFVPKQVTCRVEQKFFWITPQCFGMERLLSFKGIPFSDSFEPRVYYIVKEAEKEKVTTLQCGFYVEFKQSTFLKGTIEKGAKDQFENTWKDLQNLFINVSRDYKQKRDENNMMVNMNKSQFKNIEEIKHDFQEIEEDQELQFEEPKQFQALEKGPASDQHQPLIDENSQKFIQQTAKVIKNINPSCNIF